MKALIALGLLGMSYLGMTQIATMPIVDVELFVWTIGILTGLIIGWVIQS